jgi:hypothetical protein
MVSTLQECDVHTRIQLDRAFDGWAAFAAIQAHAHAV